MSARPWTYLVGTLVADEVPSRSDPQQTSTLPVSRVRGEEGAEVLDQGSRPIDRDQGSAVVDPHQLCVLEVFG